jgi:hypothetical protein
MARPPRPAPLHPLLSGIPDSSDVSVIDDLVVLCGERGCAALLSESQRGETGLVSRLGIGRVLLVAAELGCLRDGFSDLVGAENVAHIVVDDENREDLLPAMRAAAAIVREVMAEQETFGGSHKQKKKRAQRILFACRGGVSRSATCASAALLTRWAVEKERETEVPVVSRAPSVRSVVERLRDVRSIVDPNDGFARQLALWRAHELQGAKENRAAFHELWRRELLAHSPGASSGAALDPSSWLQDDLEEAANEEDGPSVVSLRRCAACSFALASSLNEVGAPDLVEEEEKGPSGGFISRGGQIWCEFVPWMDSSLRFHDKGELRCPSCSTVVGRFDTFVKERWDWDQKVVERIRARARQQGPSSGSAINSPDGESFDVPPTSLESFVAELPAWMRRTPENDRGEFVLDATKTRSERHRFATPRAES